MHRPSLAIAPALLLLTLTAGLAGCEQPSVYEGDGTADDGADTTETEGECPVGSEDCPCTEGGGCDLGLTCSAELVCELEPECPVGSDGCECTEGGTCDEGLSCLEDGAGGMSCSCVPGELGCGCLEGDACGGGLDCSSETSTCEIPGLPEDGADGWSEPSCWTSVEGEPAEYCTAQRGDALVYVRTACEVATKVASGEWERVDTWTGGCADGMPIDATGWDDAACFVAPEGGGGDCVGRIGGLWVMAIQPDCMVPLESEYEPWPIDVCSANAPAPESDFDEWRCSGSSCWARRGNLWFFPSPECKLTEQYFPVPAWPAGSCA